MDEYQNDQPTEPVVVEGKPVETAQEKKPDVPPYHTQETWEVAKDAHEKAAEDAKNAKPTDFAYDFNGYHVKAIEPTENQRAGTDGLLYEITAGDFLKVVMEKQDAITYVQTHAPHIAANKGATVPVS